MFFRRRGRAPWWVWILALVGMRQLVRSWMVSNGGATEWSEKGQRFREKIREAFSVWKEPASEPAPDEES